MTMDIPALLSSIRAGEDTELELKEVVLNLVRNSQRLSGRRPELEQIGQATKLTIYAATSVTTVIE